jgi:menaquinone-dependent protoporphyrinogen oxidase
MTVAIVYASTHGHTGKIASRIAETMRAEGLEVEVAEAGERADRLIRDCEAVLVAGSVHRGSHQPEVVEFVRRHRHRIQEVPSAFVSVSLTAADDKDEELAAETRRMVDEFVEDTGWTPGRTATVAGAFQFSKYRPFERLVMRLIARRHGTEIDPWEDLDLTDWNAVEQFAQQFAGRLRDHDRSVDGATSTGQRATYSDPGDRVRLKW